MKARMFSVMMFILILFSYAKADELTTAIQTKGEMNLNEEAKKIAAASENTKRKRAQRQIDRSEDQFTRQAGRDR